MEVLYLSAPFPWPPNRGDRLTGYQMIRALSRGDEVTLASFTDGCEELRGAKAVRALCRRVETVHLSARSRGRRRSPACRCRSRRR